MKVKLTPSFIEKIKPPAQGREIYWDEAHRGLGLQITHTGSQTFVVQYRLLGGRSRGATVEPTKPARAAIVAFLKDARATGPAPVRELQDRVATAGLIAPGKFIWQAKTWRTAGRALKVKHVQDQDGWLWMLPPARPSPAVPSQVLQQKPDAPSIPPTAPDLKPDAPVSAPDALAEARRRFIAERLHWHETPEAQSIMKAGRESAEKYLQSGDLRDLFPTEH